MIFLPGFRGVTSSALPVSCGNPTPPLTAATLTVAIEAVQRSTVDGRFDPHTDATALATRLWVVSHGACNLACSDVIAASEVTDQQSSYVRSPTG
jgi:hypothetical protein